MTSEPTRQEHDAMTMLDRNRTTFSEPSEPSEPKDDEMPDDGCRWSTSRNQAFRLVAPLLRS